MPFNGFTPFLATIITFYFKQEVVCQCSLTGLLHFYCKKTDFINQIKVCQCPSTGLHHFYQLWRLLMLQKTCVNVLQRAASISTLCMFKCSRYSIKGVNALQRAASISTLKENSLFLDGTLVSMPFNGLTSFLHVAPLEHRDFWKWCVNALQRAYIISTAYYPSQFTMPCVCQCPSTGLHHFYGKDNIQ